MLMFAPTSPLLLILGFVNNTLELYDAKMCQLPLWSHMLCTVLPNWFTHLCDTMLGIPLVPVAQEGNDMDDAIGGGGSSSSSNRNQTIFALFWGPTWLYKVQFAAPVGWGGFDKKQQR